MTKPKNFPGRREQRAKRAQGVVISAEAGKRTSKKTPQASWSGARSAHRHGRLGR